MPPDGFEPPTYSIESARLARLQSENGPNAPALWHTKTGEHRPNCHPNGKQTANGPRVLRFPLERVAFPPSVRRFLDDLTNGAGAA